MYLVIINIIIVDPPILSIRGVSSYITEGQDVYLHCVVDSNPEVYKIGWIHGVSTV